MIKVSCKDCFLIVKSFGLSRLCTEILVLINWNTFAVDVQCQTLLGFCKLGEFGKTFQVLCVWLIAFYFVWDLGYDYCLFGTHVYTLYFSVRPAGNDVIGVDLGTTNSCVAVMEGKVGLF